MLGVINIDIKKSMNLESIVQAGVIEFFENKKFLDKLISLNGWDNKSFFKSHEAKNQWIKKTAQEIEKILVNILLVQDSSKSIKLRPSTKSFCSLNDTELKALARGLTALYCLFELKDPRDFPTDHSFQNAILSDFSVELGMIAIFVEHMGYGQLKRLAGMDFSDLMNDIRLLLLEIDSNLSDSPNNRYLGVLHTPEFRGALACFVPLYFSEVPKLSEMWGLLDVLNVPKYNLQSDAFHRVRATEEFKVGVQSLAQHTFRLFSIIHAQDFSISRHQGFLNAAGTRSHSVQYDREAIILSFLGIRNKNVENLLLHSHLRTSCSYPKEEGDIFTIRKKFLCSAFDDYEIAQARFKKLYAKVENFERLGAESEDIVRPKSLVKEARAEMDLASEKLLDLNKIEATFQRFSFVSCNMGEEIQLRFNDFELFYMSLLELSLVCDPANHDKSAFFAELIGVMNAPIFKGVFGETKIEDSSPISLLVNIKLMLGVSHSIEKNPGSGSYISFDTFYSKVIKAIPESLRFTNVGIKPRSVLEKSKVWYLTLLSKSFRSPDENAILKVLEGYFSRLRSQEKTMLEDGCSSEKVISVLLEMSEKPPKQLAEEFEKIEAPKVELEFRNSSSPDLAFNINQNSTFPSLEKF